MLPSCEQEGFQEIIQRLDHDDDGSVTEEGADKSNKVHARKSAGTHCIDHSDQAVLMCGLRARAFTEFLLWWAKDDSSLVQGVSMKLVKGAWSAPAEILYYLFEDPMWFQQMGLKGAPLIVAGEVIVWSVNVLIIISTVAFCVESMRVYSADPDVCPPQDPQCDPEFWADVWYYVEVLCVAVFTLDFLIRGMCCYVLGTLNQFINEPYNWVDVMAIAPFFLTGLWPNMVDLRFLRVIRLTRILKSLGAKMEAVGSLVFQIVQKAAPALGLPIFLMMLSCMCLAGFEYYSEQTKTVVCTLESGEKIEPWIGLKGTPGTEDCSWSDPVVSTDTSGIHYPFGTALSLVEVSIFSLSKADMTAKVYNSSADSYGTYTHVSAWGWRGEYDMITVGEAKGLYDVDGDGVLREVTGFGCACPGTLSYRGFDDELRSSEVFPDVFTATWWTLVTYTTVGYGDINPQTPVGQLFAAVTMFVGVFFLAMPLSIVGGTFTSEYNNVQSNLERQAVQAAISEAEAAMSPEERAEVQREKQQAAADCVDRRLKEFGPVTAHASVKAHFQRCRMLAKTLYDVVPDDSQDIKEEMGRFLLKLKAADYNAKKVTIEHQKQEDEILSAKSSKREKMRGVFKRNRKKDKDSGGSPRSPSGSPKSDLE